MEPYPMKSAVLAVAALALAAPVLLNPVPAAARGCLKGALVGGAAGHMVHHGMLGAIGGCVVGHHMANERYQQPQSQAQNPHPSAAPQTGAPQSNQ